MLLSFKSLDLRANMSLPKEMKAIVFHTKGDQAVKTISLPPLRPNYLLIKVECVALNPTDWKHVTHGQGASPFSIVGCDYAGTVVSIGSEVKKSFKRGDKIYGCAHGGNFNQPYDGVFAEYAMVRECFSQGFIRYLVLTR